MFESKEVSHVPLPDVARGGGPDRVRRRGLCPGEEEDDRGREGGLRVGECATSEVPARRAIAEDGRRAGDRGDAEGAGRAGAAGGDGVDDRGEGEAGGDGTRGPHRSGAEQARPRRHGLCGQHGQWILRRQDHVARG
ncbi:MAG: hypothetical protein FJ272_12550 [Planctomycetes bacterium]|nr:hypothetical protein [Planctomycetota bacterium]